MAIGRKLKQILDERNITIKEFAQQIDVPPTTLYSFIKRDSENPKIDLMKRISHALNIDINNLADTDELAIIDIKEHPEKWGIDKDKPGKDRIEHALKKLNSTGKEKAAERVEELTEIPRYTNPDEPRE